ncbi:nudix-type nucleoside diphosphatase (YffH/AdpP family) [Palleronia aestuarii]|uniref:ADP-ribose pyrophosphatase n=1 Tax=Palleronia aestuarii TaxID=568105 RepID=A0A2W7N9V3_9RHOB|nr:NUDIX domain-containing protein [Palleronia aestuarii]PZX13644.1 nudix-type nucleoside diphosphatase (YffH/AdpP family) [Palleronia aestuarii]
MTRFFFAGPLRDATFRGVIAGADLSTSPATLSGARAVRAEGTDHPLIDWTAGHEAEGLLAMPGDEIAARIAFYATAQGLSEQVCRVSLDGTETEATLFSPAGAQSVAQDWSLEAWSRKDRATALHAARETMAYYGQADAREVRRRMPTIRMRAASHARAETEETPRTLRSGVARDSVEVRERRQPYANYFAVTEVDFDHPRFDGGRSAEVTRAALSSGDAVTVLPYDPVRERVLVIEQFRFGPYIRGDRHPWVLEPIAGRIDPGEMPEHAARREAEEESGLALGRLIPIGRYYPSPGVMTEYLFTYVAIADLPDGAGGLGGAEQEEEDIRSHVIAFDHFMELVQSGEVNTGPLLLSALWLQRERAGLA